MLLLWPGVSIIALYNLVLNMHSLSDSIFGYYLISRLHQSFLGIASATEVHLLRLLTVSRIIVCLTLSSKHWLLHRVSQVPLTSSSWCWISLRWWVLLLGSAIIGIIILLVVIIIIVLNPLIPLISLFLVNASFSSRRSSLIESLLV
jgi:hypothetical protein